MIINSNVNKVETQCDSSAQRITSSLSSFKKIESSAKETGVLAHIARQYMSMYTRAKTKSSPTILELGTREGISTSMFLKICQQNGGKVVSVDVDDCSDVTDDENWRFVQRDSTDVEHVLGKAPGLFEGIDVLLIDSLHVRSHVD
jgi:predicted O-methyltransferase YrrM